MTRLQLARDVEHPPRTISELRFAEGKIVVAPSIVFTFESNDPMNGFPCRGRVAVHSIAKISAGDLPGEHIVTGIGSWMQEGFKKNNFTFAVHLLDRSPNESFIEIIPARTLLLSFGAFCTTMYRREIEDPSSVLCFFDGDQAQKITREQERACEYGKDFDSIRAALTLGIGSERIMWFEDDKKDGGDPISRKVAAFNMFLATNKLPPVQLSDADKITIMEISWTSWLEHQFAVHGLVKIETGLRRSR